MKKEKERCKKRRTKDYEPRKILISQFLRKKKLGYKLGKMTHVHLQWNGLQKLLQNFEKRAKRWTIP